MLLYMPGELQLALAQLQSNRRLGRSYAGLLALTEGFYASGCLDKEVYEALKERYSQKLPCSIVTERAKPRTTEAAQEQTLLRKLDADLSNVIKQWSTVPTKSRLHWANKAKEFKDKLSNAQMVLDLFAADNTLAKQETQDGATQT